MNAASLAPWPRRLPFDGRSAAVRLGLIDGEWVVNPTFQELEDATFDIVVAGAKNAQAGVDILMIEGEAPTTPGRCSRRRGRLAPTEEVVAQGLDGAKARSPS
jgi:polyribonucleotide nucleotidyltransferase